MIGRRIIAGALVPAVLGLAGCARAGDRPVVLATTTSVEDSGLLGHLLDRFGQDHPGQAVRALTVGSGEALELGRRGDADLLLVHHPEGERRFLGAGHGDTWTPLMTNDFVILGPAADPALVAGAAGATDAFRRIARGSALFLSRGDESGTHAREREIWQAAGSEREKSWYLEAGQGMGPLLLMASERDAYTLGDRATFTEMAPRLGLRILLEGDPELRNVYSVIRVRSSAGSASAEPLLSWLVSAAGQTAIEAYRDPTGRPFFRTLSEEERRAEASARSLESTLSDHPAATGGGSGVSGTGRPGGRQPSVSGDASGRLGALRLRFHCRSTPPAKTRDACG